VDDTGLDKAHKSQGNLQILSELAHKLAQFDMGSLWKTLGDSERNKLFVVAAELIQESKNEGAIRE